MQSKKKETQLGKKEEGEEDEERCNKSSVCNGYQRNNIHISNNRSLNIVFVNDQSRSTFGQISAQPK